VYGAADTTRRKLILKEVLLPFEGVLEAADDVLDFALQFVGFAFGFQFGITGCLANELFGSAAKLFCRSGNAVLIHDFFSKCCENRRLIPTLIKRNA
jgi:hypothetical protein